MRFRFVSSLLAVTASGFVLVAAAASSSASASSRSSRSSMRASASLPSYTLFGWDNQAVSAPVALSGTFSNAPAGASAQLFSKGFPFTGKEQAGRIEALTVASDGSAPFSFSVRPTTATRYFVELLDPGGSLDNTFQLHTVYVASKRRLLPKKVSCTASTCRVVFSLVRFLPPGVAKYELTKPYYDYLGLAFARAAPPPSPKVMIRQRPWSASRTIASRVAGRYETSFRFSFHLKARHYRYVSDVCTIDSEQTDGFGLPGRHGCGSASVPVGGPYLG